MCPHERAGTGERSAPSFQASIPKMPRMNHVGPNLQCHRDIRRAGRSRKARRVLEQGLIRAHLDQSWRKAFQSRIERRNPRVPPVKSGGNIGIGQFEKVTPVYKGIYGILAGEGRTGHGQIGPR